MASSGTFYQLPDELIMKIFSYLDIPDLIRNIQHVDSHWKAIVQDISFWRDKVFTIYEQTEEEVIVLLQNMPSLRAVVATRAVFHKVILTLCQSNKCITRLELHSDEQLTVSDLETIVKNLPQIQHLAFPLFETENKSAMKCSTLIQQLPELLSLALLGYGFNTKNCFFLKAIATKCQLLHELNLGVHSFLIEDIISFLKAKKQIITKFAAVIKNSVEMIHHLGSCKQLQTLCLTYHGHEIAYIPVLDLPNLKHLRITGLEEQHFSITARNLQKSTMSNLVKLDLTTCYLDGVEFESILTKFVHLKILILTYCQIPDGDDFRHIGRCTHLEYLNVNKTLITDLAVEVIAETCTKLKHLDISDCHEISDFSLKCLMKCKELQTLILDSTDILGKYFHLIPIHLGKLLELHLEDCYYLQFPYLQQLQQYMPHLQVYAGFADL